MHLLSENLIPQLVLAQRPRMPLVPTASPASNCSNAARTAEPYLAPRKIVVLLSKIKQYVLRFLIPGFLEMLNNAGISSWSRSLINRMSLLGWR